MQIKDLLSIENTLFFPAVKSKKKALELIAETIAMQTHLPTNTIFDNLVLRERLGSTAIGHGIAIPHCRLPVLEQPTSCLMLLKEGIDFDAEDHLLVDIIFSLVVPLSSPEDYLTALAAVTKIFHDKERRKHIRKANSATELYQVLNHA